MPFAIFMLIFSVFKIEKCKYKDLLYEISEYLEITMPHFATLINLAFLLFLYMIIVFTILKYFLFQWRLKIQVLWKKIVDDSNFFIILYVECRNELNFLYINF